MTIIKLTSTGKAVQVITDEGEVFQTSVNFLMGLLMGKAKAGFITTKRMPFMSAPDRFAPSELYDPGGLFIGNSSKTLTSTNDALSVKMREKNEKKKSFQDKMVW